MFWPILAIPSSSNSGRTICVYSAVFSSLKGMYHASNGFTASDIADDAVVEDIEPRGLGVETEFAVFPDLGNHFAQLGGILHKAVIVGRGLRVLNCMASASA